MCMFTEVCLIFLITHFTKYSKDNRIEYGLESCGEQKGDKAKCLD